MQVLTAFVQMSQDRDTRCTHPACFDECVADWCVRRFWFIEERWVVWMWFCYDDCAMTSLISLSCFVHAAILFQLFSFHLRCVLLRAMRTRIAVWVNRWMIAQTIHSNNASTRHVSVVVIVILSTMIRRWYWLTDHSMVSWHGWWYNHDIESAIVTVIGRTTICSIVIRDYQHRYKHVAMIVNW